MSREQLETIANQFSIKKIKNLEDADLAFAILDAQATAASLLPDKEKAKPKRGRPRKEVSGGAQEGAKRDAETAEAPMAAVPVAEEVDMGRIDKPVRAKKTAGGPPAIQMDESVLDSIGIIDDDIMNMMSK